MTLDDYRKMRMPGSRWRRDARRTIVEVVGREDEARRLVDEQAPHRLARRCPACSAKPGQECDDLSMPFEAFAVLLVPHHARLVGHLGNGPLFGGRYA